MCWLSGVIKNNNSCLLCVCEELYSLRKPKRVRTAFSPAQLLHLERAFEQNRYVVGQERRQLAASLNLSETQVWGTLIACNSRKLGGFANNGVCHQVH